MEHAVGVVNLSRFIGEAKLLPTAYVVCCTLGASITKGFEREDGSREVLSPEDLSRCFGITNALIAASIAAASRVYTSRVSSTCQNRGTNP
ncbi:hypothetical protein BD309DRAFT_616750 [Dichomitus squalens]|nr:hypothetical protein BD309DRAFT_616750 [Dichomitus squalens]